MKFAHHNIQVSNERNHGLYDYLKGFADEQLKPFWLNNKEAHNEHTDVAVIRLEKIGNHIVWSIQDMQTSDTISGYAVVDKG